MILEVPYILDPSDRNFAPTRKWFESGTLPENLLFTTLEGEISLFGCRHAGAASKFPPGVSVGKVKPTELVLHSRTGDQTDALSVRELRSQIDGLQEWTGPTAIKQTRSSKRNGLTQKITVEVEAKDEISWHQGDAAMSLRVSWLADPTKGNYQIRESVTLTSRFPAPVSVEAHLAEHRKVTDFLSFAFGCPIHFRRHEIKDDRFPHALLNGKVMDTPFIQLLTQHTLSEHNQPAPPQSHLRAPLADSSVVDPAGLQRWSDRYTDWARFIHPTVSAINRAGASIENVVVNTSMSLEAAAALIGPQADETETHYRGRPTTATNSFRCLIASGVDWAGLCESPVGLARAIANNYNTIKHPNRGEFPPVLETYLISEVSLLVARVLAIKIAAPNFTVTHNPAFRGPDLSNIVELFKANNMFIDSIGDFIPPRTE